MTIPAPVLAAAAGLVEMYGPQFELLGSRDGTDYYLFLIPQSETTGFPAVYGFKDGQAVQLPGLDAVDTMRSFGIE